MDKSTSLRPLTDPAALESVVITDKLSDRPSRAPNYEAENAALAELALCLASKPESVLDLLTQKAVDLCHAHCAGISIEEGREPGAVFRWMSVSGPWKQYAGGTLPRWNSPCATVLDRGVPQLMTNVHRAYPVPVELSADISEVLLVPLRTSRGTIFGTIWIVSHQPTRMFDREDLRVMESLAAFGGTAWQASNPDHAAPRDKPKNESR